MGSVATATIVIYVVACAVLPLSGVRAVSVGTSHSCTVIDDGTAVKVRLCVRIICVDSSIVLSRVKSYVCFQFPGSAKRGLSLLGDESGPACVSVANQMPCTKYSYITPEYTEVFRTSIQQYSMKINTRAQLVGVRTAWVIWSWNNRARYRYSVRVSLFCIRTPQPGSLFWSCTSLLLSACCVCIYLLH